MHITTTSVTKKLSLLILIVAVLYVGRSLLIPVAIAGLLAMLLLPLSQWLERWKLPKFIAVLCCLLLILALVGTLVWIVSWQVSALIQDIALVRERVSVTVKEVQAFLFNQFGISSERQNDVLFNEQFSVAGIITQALGSMTQLLGEIVLVTAYVFLFLYYRNHLKRFYLQALKPNHRREGYQVLMNITRVSQQYLLGLSKMIGCLWILYGIGFTLIGVKNPIFFAVFCGFCEIIPFIGNITGTSLTLLVSLVQGAELSMLLGILFVYGTIQFIQGWILEPLILGHEVRINPLATVVALVIGGMLWGIAGIFLAIPLVAMFKVTCDHIDSLKAVGFLIGMPSGHKTLRR